MWSRRKLYWVVQFKVAALSGKHQTHKKEPKQGNNKRNVEECGRWCHETGTVYSKDPHLTPPPSTHPIVRSAGVEYVLGGSVSPSDDQSQCWIQLWVLPQLKCGKVIIQKSEPLWVSSRSHVGVCLNSEQVSVDTVCACCRPCVCVSHWFPSLPWPRKKKDQRLPSILIHKNRLAALNKEPRLQNPRLQKHPPVKTSKQPSPHTMSIQSPQMIRKVRCHFVSIIVALSFMCYEARSSSHLITSSNTNTERNFENHLKASRPQRPFPGAPNPRPNPSMKRG